jgi:uncharacterized membrane protein YeaQ/YmgE (transglycosylase-associated protein family)
VNFRYLPCYTIHCIKNFFGLKSSSRTISFTQGGFVPAVLFSYLLSSQTIVVEYRRGLIGWILIGLIAGWLAGKIARGRGFGCIGDVVLGLIGSLIGGWVFTKLGIFGGGFLYSLAAATLGAVILVSIAHLFSSGD